jgi:rhodanese-related sulfurtransferase
MLDVPLEITPLEAKRLIDAGGAGLRLIDVRDPDEFAFCHLEGAELIPLMTLPSDAPARLPDKTAPLLVYCHHGMRSAQAANYLRQLGYANARSIAGGTDRWSTEIDPSLPRY